MTRPKSAFDALMANTKKQKSPDVTAGKKRGRPTKNSPRFVKKSSNKNMIKSSTPKRSLNFHDENSNPPETLVNDLEKLNVEEPPVEIICLNGKSELSDIRKLFREWIYSVDNSAPTDDDCETVIDFFVQKTKNEENDFVYSILKTLCRMCQDANQPNWSSMYNKIVKNVQDIYKSKHNGKSLYLSFKLNT